MRDEAPDICPNCKSAIEWSDWSRARVDESLVRDKAEIRIGRCRCPGKTYIQTRPSRGPPAPDEESR